MQTNNQIGYITNINHYLVKVEGVPQARVNEVVATSAGQKGIVISLAKDYTGVLMLDVTGLKGGQEVHRTGEIFNVNVGSFLLGRTINTLGLPIDGKSSFPTNSEKRNIFMPSPGIAYRERITEPFYTGITSVDVLVPIGKGQRELVIGDAKTGKTFFLLQAILNQKIRNVVCIYAAIGKSEVEVKEIGEFLEKNGSLFNTVIVASSASSSSTLIYYAPYTAMTIAEYFQSMGKDVLIIFDDLSNHAKYTREIYLLAERMPGRESYPGDIFYTHSKLLERAGKFNQGGKGGSITAFPVVETKYQDLTSFIPTTLMSMTDGHIYFNEQLFYQGRRPPVDVGFSVSRVGNQTRSKLMRDLATKVKNSLATYHQIENLSRFGSEISEQTKLLLNIGMSIEEFLTQEEGEILEVELQAFILALVYTSFINGKDRLFIRRNRKKVIFGLTHDSEISSKLKEMAKMESIDEYIKGAEKFVPKINAMLK